METASSAPPESPPPRPPPPPPSQTEEELKKAAEEEAALHKTKVIQFLGRTTSIVLQNDNGPCPLLAICNVLLLRNSLNLSPDVPEVSQEKLLSLVAERLIDSNSNANNRDAEYVENQQQNIADAIDLLPRLTTGIDVNIKYRRIDDFEFTRECAIFDLLDIPLYHGWIVDPQDYETANAIGLKSYNTLMGGLVALEAQSMKSELPKYSEEDTLEAQSMKIDLPENPEEDDVDFVAATTATLGVPSPTISRGIPSDDSPISVPDESYLLSLDESHTMRKGDIEEEADLLRALKLSETESVAPVVDDVSMNKAHLSLISEESTSHKNSELDAPVELVKGNHASYIANDSSAVSSETGNNGLTKMLSDKTVCSSENPDLHDPQRRSTSAEPIIIPEEPDLFFQANQNSTLVEPKENLVILPEEPDLFFQANQNSTIMEPKANLIILPEEPDLFFQANQSSTPVEPKENIIATSESYEHIPNCDMVQTESTSISEAGNIGTKSSDIDMLGSSLTPATDSKTSGDLDKTQALASNIASSEPIYEGEDCILDSKTESCENQEPVYEGEVVLAEQVENMAALSDMMPSSEMTVKDGEVIENFLRSSASQLTVYGLFCLQDGMKERELCVFFRNNHFNTMFKFEGELYILVTDQGYINQPDLVWEKLNEVNGDTLYMTGNFKEFKVDDHSNSAWDEHNAMSSTADYLASIDTSPQQQSNFK
ncbi:hypothetical protein LIER_12586 [Lithospermum erythrorhizon]|uniref:MINDY deubiquitinase domain-containing protein n=1 Tax=Lithospermum erythrorhizon TaxID=34254 RepID=A0AAV3PVE4_LITER